MHVTGTIEEPQFTAAGKLRLVLEVNEREKALQEIDKLRGKQVAIDVGKITKPRSNEANRYLWRLLDLMSYAAGVDKWDLYLLEIKRHGDFIDAEIKEEAAAALAQQFRYSEIMDRDEYFQDGEYIKKCTLRGYLGSSRYNSQQMHKLLTGVIEDANDLGVETLTPTEVALLTAQIKERGPNDYTKEDHHGAFDYW